MTIKEQLILILIQLKANQYHVVYRVYSPFTHAMGLTTETNYLVSTGNKSLAKNCCAVISIGERHDFNYQSCFTTILLRLSFKRNKSAQF